MRVFLFLLLIGSLGARPLEIEVSARSALLMNAKTGAVLYEKQAHVSLYPASVTKIATALYALDRKQSELDRFVTVSADCLHPVRQGREGEPYWLASDGTMMGLKIGEILPLGVLLHGMMLVSGNDAANVVAESVAGSVPRFMEEINLYLKELGCVSTQFKNPHGYHHPEHVTTAYDLGLIMKRALEFPLFREIIGKTSYFKPKTNKQPAKELIQSNRLIKPGKYYYDKVLGGKTGYHGRALNNLVCAAEHEGRILIAVVLGCVQANERYLEAKRLFEAAFREELESRRFFEAETLFTRELLHAQGPLHAHLAEALSLSYYPAEEPECKAVLHWKSLLPPIRKGEKVGEIQIRDSKGALLKTGDLLADQDVKGTFLFTLRQWFEKGFGKRGAILQD